MPNMWLEAYILEVAYITYIIYEHVINRKRQAKTKRTKKNNTAVNAIKQATNTVDSARISLLYLPKLLFKISIQAFGKP